jgi:hypothetical protein
VPRKPVDIDALFAELTRAGETPVRIAQALETHLPEEDDLVSLLRRAVPVRALEYLARTSPWSERPRVLAAIVLNPKAPPRLALPLVPYLLWRSLADVASTARVPSAVRLRAESVLKEKIPELRLGEKITLGRLATPGVLMALLGDPDARVLESALLNPRLRESDLLALLRRPDVPVTLLAAVGGSRRWTENYPVRLTLVLEPRTPLGVALGQLSSLRKRDLLRVAGTAALPPLVQAAAQRVAGEASDDGGGRARKRP